MNYPRPCLCDTNPEHVATPFWQTIPHLWVVLAIQSTLVYRLTCPEIANAGPANLCRLAPPAGKRLARSLIWLATFEQLVGRTEEQLPLSTLAIDDGGNRVGQRVSSMSLATANELSNDGKRLPTDSRRASFWRISWPGLVSRPVNPTGDWRR